MAAIEKDIEARIAQLERKLRAVTTAGLLGLALGGAVVFGAIGQRAGVAAGARHPDPAPGTLRVRELDIVDPNGITRVKVAAPLPAPIIDGHTKTRGGTAQDTVSGILLFDADGAERSGYVTSDRGYSNVLLTLDDKRSHQHALFITEPNGGTTLRLFNADTKDRLDLAVNSGGPSISMMRGGTEIYRQPAK